MCQTMHVVGGYINISSMHLYGADASMLVNISTISHSTDNKLALPQVHHSIPDTCNVLICETSMWCAKTFVAG